MKTPQEMLAEVTAVSMSANKFAIKHTYEQRCFIYILLTTDGVSIPAVADCFGIAVGVAEKMKSQRNKRYSDIKREYNLLGRQDFVNQYFNQEMYDKFWEYQRASKEARDSEGKKPNPNATGRAGERHKVRMEDGFLPGAAYAWPVWVSEEEQHPDGYGWGSQWDDTPEKKESIENKFYNTSNEAYMALKTLFNKPNLLLK